MSAVQSVTHRPTLQIIAVCVGLLWSTGSNNLCAQQAISFNRDIRPILSNHCFSCHGPDSAARKGGFRLDQRDSATRAAESGLLAIDPGYRLLQVKEKWGTLQVYVDAHADPALRARARQVVVDAVLVGLQSAGVRIDAATPSIAPRPRVNCPARPSSADGGIPGRRSAQRCRRSSPPGIDTRSVAAPVSGNGSGLLSHTPGPGPSRSRSAWVRHSGLSQDTKVQTWSLATT